MNMGGGMNALFGIQNSRALWIVLTIAGIIAFIISSATGIFKGIRILSDLNVYLYYFLLAVIILTGPTAFMFSYGTEAFGGFLTNIFDKALFTGAAASDPWASDWTMFCWSNWMAWAPVAAVFLARITYGYTVKEVIMMNFVIPSVFSGIWMTVLGGTAINFQMTGKVDILAIMNEQGSAAAGYAVLAIAGRHRKEGNTFHLIQAALEPFKMEGHEIQYLFLSDYSFRDCIGCEGCSETYQCILQDDMQKLYPVNLESDAIILGSPTYFYNISAPMKAFLDRCYCYEIFDDHDRSIWMSLNEALGGKYAVVIAVSEQENLEDMGFAAKAMQKPLEALGYCVIQTVKVLHAFKAGEVIKK